MHSKQGTELTVCFPPECPEEFVDKAMDEIFDLVSPPDRVGWDAFQVSKSGHTNLCLCDEEEE